MRKHFEQLLRNTSACGSSSNPFCLTQGAARGQSEVTHSKATLPLRSQCCGAWEAGFSYSLLKRFSDGGVAKTPCDPCTASGPHELYLHTGAFEEINPCLTRSLREQHPNAQTKPGDISRGLRGERAA